MKTLFLAALRKLGSNRGAPRLYLDNPVQEQAGFVPGVTYTVEKYEDRNAIRIRLADEGARAVSKKERGGRVVPIIDLNSMKDLGIFDGLEQVRVLIGAGEIWVMPLAKEVRKRSRERRLKEELAQGFLSKGSVAHGAGIMNNALHNGLKEAGIHTRLKWAIEYEDDSLEQASRDSEAWGADTVAVAMPMQDVAFADDYVRSHIKPVSLVSAGLPCTASSPAGRAKKRLASPEDDAKAGHLVMAFMALIARANPAVIALENVPAYMTSSSAAMLRTQLRELGYNVEEVTLDGGDYAIEARVRKVLLAVTEGVQFDAQQLVAPPRVEQTIGEILDPVDPDAKCWSEMTYLVEKEKRDIAAGKGFRMAIAKLTDTAIGAQGAGYAKSRSTEVKIPHPSRDGLMRLMTPREHAKVKGVPLNLIEGVTSATRAHAMLGQSVVWPAFRHLGEFLGSSLLAAHQEKSEEPAPFQLQASAA